VKLSKTHQPGSAVGFPAGHGNATPVFYHVGYYAPDNSWWIQYGGEWIGKINASYWGGAAGLGGFAKANEAQWYGEIAFAPGHNCTPMGDDFYGNLPNSASVTGMFYEQVVGGHSKAFPARAHLSLTSDSRYWTSNKGASEFSVGRVWR
jgi:Neprosin